VDPAAEKFNGVTPYNSMGNNPIAFADPEGDEIITSIIVGAVIGASVSGATTVATNAATGNPLFQGFGQAVAFGALGGAIGGGIGSAFAGTAFGQSTGFSVLNNFASNAAASAAFGQDITLGSAIGSLAGALWSSSIPGFTGLKGSSFKNAIGEALHNTTTGAVAGAISGGVRAAVDGTSFIDGVFGGLKYGALGGAVQTGLNILTMGTAYVPDDPAAYGDFGAQNPVYRRGTFLYRKGDGITLGRNLVTRLTGNSDYNKFLRAHETGHFLQQRVLGFGKMYGLTARSYAKYGQIYSYFKPGTLEFGANMYSMHRLGYYYLPNGVRRSFR